MRTGDAAFRFARYEQRRNRWPGVDPSVVVRLGEKALRHGPFSRGQQL